MLVAWVAGALGSPSSSGVVASAWAQKKTVIPEEKRGDPGPDTQTAKDLLKRGRYEDAIRQAKLALGRDERYIPAMMILAKSYYQLRKYELATSIIDIAKGIDPGCYECFNLLGFIALAREDRISATAAFKKATELRSDYVAAWHNLAAQYLISKNYDGAVEAAEMATRLAPSFAQAHINLGAAYRGKLRYADAERELRRAVEIDGGIADAYFNLGILYLDAKEMPNVDLIGKFTAAITYFNKYKQTASSKLGKDDPVEIYLAEARAGIDREQKRLERLKKQQERAAPKAAEPAEATKPEAKPEGAGGDK